MTNLFNIFKNVSLESFTVFASFVLYTITAISYYMKGNYPWALTWFSYALANIGLIWAATK